MSGLLYRYDVIHQTRLRAAHNDADESVFISAHPLHGVIEAPGKIQLWVLSTPDCRTDKHRHTHTRYYNMNRYLRIHFAGSEQSWS